MEPEDQGRGDRHKIYGMTGTTHANREQIVRSSVVPRPGSGASCQGMVDTWGSEFFGCVLWTRMRNSRILTLEEGVCGTVSGVKVNKLPSDLDSVGVVW